MPYREAPYFRLIFISIRPNGIRTEEDYVQLNFSMEKYWPFELKLKCDSSKYFDAIESMKHTT